MAETRYCFQCGEPITSKYGKKFCSIRCAAAHANTFSIVATKKDNPYPCEECGTIFQKKHSRGKFCSRSCSAKFNNRYKSKASRHSCEGCDSSILLRFFYCSPSCKTAHKIRQWLAGEFDATKKHSISKFIRDYLIAKSEYKCGKCGYDKGREDGASILQIHHKDGDWKNSGPENLEVLCPNCHALTENYGARNKGKGRTWKRNYDQFAGVVQ